MSNLALDLSKLVIPKNPDKFYYVTLYDELGSFSLIRLQLACHPIYALSSTISRKAIKPASFIVYNGMNKSILIKNKGSTSNIHLRL